MAITKQEQIMQFPANIYVKIVNFYVDEVGEDEVGKVYNVKVGTVFYSDETKKYGYKTNDYIFEGMRDGEFTIPNLYNKLKTLEEFEGYTDI